MLLYGTRGFELYFNFQLISHGRTEGYNLWGEGMGDVNNFIIFFYLLITYNSQKNVAGLYQGLTEVHV